MNILGLDTSSLAASCALLEENHLTAEFFLNAGLTHSQTLLPLVEDMLRHARRSLKDMDVLAISHGPGSFTGLRIGMASVKGMALGLDRPVLGVSTLLALAYNLLSFPGLIVPCMDARRGALYTAIFQSDGKELKQLLPDSNIPIAQLGHSLASLLPSGETAYLVGDGAHLVKEALGDTFSLALAPATLLHQRAGSVCLAAKKLLRTQQPLPADRLEPNYLRISQAERERLEQQSQET